MFEPKFWKNHIPQECKRSIQHHRTEALPIKTKAIELGYIERFELPENEYGFTRMFISFDHYYEPDSKNPAVVWLEVRIFTASGDEFKTVIDLQLGEIFTTQNFEELKSMNLDFFKLIDIDTLKYTQIIVGEASYNPNDNFYGQEA